MYARCCRAVILISSFSNERRCKKDLEVAKKQSRIFLTFGAHHVLQSGNGGEFTVVVITELVFHEP
ncbi:hypothetical protein ACI65C_009030 [Semiaphis heraclei]